MRTTFRSVSRWKIFQIFLAAIFVCCCRIVAAARTAEPSPSPPHYSNTGVIHVHNEGDPSKTRNVDRCIARRDDAICVYAQHLDAWLAEMKAQNRIPQDAKLSDLVLLLDNVAIKGLHPEQSFPVPPDADSEDYPQVRYLRFALRRTDDSKVAWNEILNRPNFRRQMDVSVGFENGEKMQTWVLKSASESVNTFLFQVIPPLRFWTGVVLIGGALAVFIYLARCTDIVRDTNQPLRPDKRWPYSLARMQMAFWFFLVLGAFFFLWVLLGDMDTLNSSALGLIGISAGTALGSVFVDSAKAPALPSESDLPPVNLSQPRKKICQDIGALIATAQQELKDLETARKNIDPKAEDLLKANAEAQAKKLQQISDLERQRDYFSWPAWKGVMYDLLAENDVICFHRFQIFVWTLVLGIMFVANVYSELAMPEFSATLLGLLGISAGTYVGFKIPEAKNANAAS